MSGLGSSIASTILSSWADHLGCSQLPGSFRCRQVRSDLVLADVPDCHFSCYDRSLVELFELLQQLGVLGIGLVQDRDTRIGVFPNFEELLIGRSGLGRIALHGVSACKI
jgi:hypothetical protein